jgi:hypothetical protein
MDARDGDGETDKTAETDETVEQEESAPKPGTGDEPGDEGAGGVNRDAGQGAGGQAE